MSRLWLIVVVALSVAACKSESSVGEAADKPTMTSADVSAGIKAVQIDDVWVFHHNPDIHMTARHGGTAEIGDGCLYVDDTVIVWDVDQLEEAEQIVGEVKAGVRRELLIGGGGISLDEGARPEDMPDVITELCPVTAVWYGSP